MPEEGPPTIGERAESILCVGVFGDADDDFEVVHKFASRLPVPALGGALEFTAIKDDDIGTEITYSKRLFDMLDVEVKTDHTLSGGSVEIKNDSAVDGLELKLESEIDDKGEPAHKVSAEYSMQNLGVFNFASLRGLFNFADREVEAEVGVHTDKTSVSMQATYDIKQQTTAYVASAELRGDTCTLAMKYDPSAEEAEQKIAALHVQVSDATDVALSADGNKNWLVGVQTQMDDDTSMKARLGVKEDAGTEISCFLSKKLRPDFTVMVTSAIQSKKLMDFNAHRFGLQALYEVE